MKKLILKISCVFFYCIFSSFQLMAQNNYLKLQDQRNVKLKYSKELESHIHKMKGRSYTDAYRLNDFYHPLFEFKLKQNNLPHEFKYLPILESKMDYLAVSRADAKGLWQIIPGTGFELGLLESKCISNYFDPLAATQYATSYLKWLYDRTNDFNMTLAAYNWGIGNVLKLIKTKGTKDFYKLKESMPEETRNYIFNFHAIVFLAESNYFNYKKIQFNYKNVVKIKINKKYSIDELKTLFSDFKFLNPQFLCDTISKNSLIYVKKKELKKLNK